MSKLVFHSYRDLSRGNLGQNLLPEVDPFATATYEDVQLGCMLRMADATELMAKSHTQLVKEKMELEKEVQRLNDVQQWLIDKHDSLVRSNNALQGVITRRNNEIKKLKEQNTNP